MAGQVMPFDGETYDRAIDQKPMGAQLAAVYQLMKDGRYRTLYRIAQIVKGSETGISARLRDLRKEKFGGHKIERKRNWGKRTWLYRIVPPPPRFKQGTLFPMGGGPYY